MSDAPALTVIQVVVGAEPDAWKGPGLFLRWGHVCVDQGIPSIPSVLPQMQLVLILCGAKENWFEKAVRLNRVTVSGVTFFFKQSCRFSRFSLQYLSVLSFLDYFTSRVHNPM